MVRRTKEDAEVTKQQLLDSALKLFSEQGVAQTTLAQIASDAGVTRGALYWHFKGKDEVMLSLYAHFMGLLKEYQEGVRAEGYKDIHSILRQITVHADALSSSTSLYRFAYMWAYMNERTYHNEKLTDTYSQVFKGWKSEIAEAISCLPLTAWDRGVKGDCTIIADTLWRTYSGYFYEKLGAREQFSAEEILKSLHLVCRGGGLIV